MGSHVKWPVVTCLRGRQRGSVWGNTVESDCDSVWGESTKTTRHIVPSGKTNKLSTNVELPVRFGLLKGAIFASP